MPQIRYEVAGVDNVENVSDALVDYFLARPGYSLVVSEADAAELHGQELLEAARAAGVDAPTTLSADEKRAAIVAATAPAGEPIPPHAPPPDLTPEEQAAADADPSTPPADPPAATKRRAAAKES